MTTNERINFVAKEIAGTLDVIDELDGELEAMKTKVDQLQAELGELKKQAEDEKFLKRHDTYYAISINGKVERTTWYDDDQDRMRTLIGNVFETREAAEKTAEFIKANHEKLAILRDLSEFAEPEDALWNDKDHWRLMCDMETGELKYVRDVGNCAYKSPLVYFATDGDADRAVRAIGEDRIKKYLFGYKKEDN